MPFSLCVHACGTEVGGFTWPTVTIHSFMCQLDTWKTQKRQFSCQSKIRFTPQIMRAQSVLSSSSCCHSSQTQCDWLSCI